MKGIWISEKDTSLVDTTLDKRILDSQNFFFKIHDEGVVDMTISSTGTTEKVVPHNLGYPAAFWHYNIPDPNNFANRYMGRFLAETIYELSVDSYMDKNSLHLSWTDTSPGDGSPGTFANFPYKVQFYYYIFKERLE